MDNGKYKAMEDRNWKTCTDPRMDRISTSATDVVVSPNLMVTSSHWIFKVTIFPIYAVCLYV